MGLWKAGVLQARLSVLCLCWCVVGVARCDGHLRAGGNWSVRQSSRTPGGCRKVSRALCAVACTGLVAVTVVLG
jgi:hypothetical protein